MVKLYINKQDPQVNTEAEKMCIRAVLRFCLKTPLNMKAKGM